MLGLKQVSIDEYARKEFEVTHKDALSLANIFDVSLWFKYVVFHNYGVSRDDVVQWANEKH